MKFLLTIALVLSSSFALAEEATAPAASATPMTTENTSATAKKRLRHIGKNIEKLGDKAGKKAGVKDVKDSSAPDEKVAD